MSLSLKVVLSSGRKENDLGDFSAWFQPSPPTLNALCLLDLTATDIREKIE